MVAFSKIVIAGSGIIGNSISYYLAKRNIPCTIIDPVGNSPAASGKAGGFLAKDWSDGSYVGPLQRHSFDLHAELAEEFGEETTEYRRLTCAAVAVGGGKVEKPGGKKLEGVEWADVGVLGSREMGNEETIAQVHPKKLSEAFWRYSQENVGSNLVIGRVVEAVLENNEVKGVKLENGEVIEADALVVACGPWTDEARSWFGIGTAPPLPRMMGVKYHSMLVKSPRVLTQAVFFQGAGDPEVYPRPDGDAYITGFADNPIVVEESPGQEEVREESIMRLKTAMEAVSTELGSRDPHTTQSCYLPTTRDGSPIIGKISPFRGAFVASGHSCWGILNAPATGEAMAELILDGKTSKVDIEPFSPDRFFL